MEKEYVSEIFDKVLFDNGESEDYEFQVGPKYELFGGSLEQFVTELKPVIDEAENLQTRAEGEQATVLYQTILNQSVKLRCRSEYENLNEYLNFVINVCEDNICTILKNSSNEDFIKTILDWVLDEARLKQYSDDETLEILPYFFKKLYSLPNFNNVVEKYLTPSNKRESIPSTLIKLFHFSQKGDSENISNLLVLNENTDEVHKQYIILLIEEGRDEEALIYSQLRLKYSNEKYIQLLNVFGCYNTPYRIWYCSNVIELYVKLNKLEEASKFIIETYLNRIAYARLFRVECYKFLANNLTKEQRNELLTTILKGENLTWLDIEEICAFEENWPALIDACKKISRISEVFWVFDKHKDHLYDYPVELIDMLKHVISNYVSKDSGKDRHFSIICGLKNLLSIQGSEQDLMDFVLTLSLHFKKRRTLVELLDKFIEDNGLIEKYQDFKMKKQATLKNEINKPNTREKIDDWVNYDWAENKIKLMKEKNNLFDISRNWPKNLSLLSTEQAEKLLEIYKSAVFYYIEKSKDNVVARIRNITNSFEKIKASTINYDLSQKLIFELILSLTLKYPKRINLIGLLYKYINDNSLSEKFQEFVQDNQTEIEKGIIVSNSTQLNDEWAENEWAEEKINTLNNKKSIFEIEKVWPSDFSVLSPLHKEQLLQIYRESIFVYAENSKKDESTKAHNILLALNNIKCHDKNIEFLKTLIIDLKNRYPKRFRFREMLNNALK